MKELRKLIREEVAKSIPFEHDMQVLKNTNWNSQLYAGHKPFTGKDYDFPNKKPEIKPVNSVPSSEQYERIKRSNRTEREKDFQRDLSDSLKSATHSRIKGEARMEEEAFIPSQTQAAPRLDVIMCGAVLLEFNVNKIFKDLNDSYVFHISLHDKTSVAQEEYIPGGLASKMTLQDIADKHGVELRVLKLQLKKGVKVEMEHTDDELVALEIAMDHIVEDPKYYDKLARVEKNENNMGVSAYSKPNANKRELKMLAIMEKLNKVFGTMYYIDVSYPRENEDIFVIKSGKMDESKNKPLSYGQFLDFDKVREQQEAMLRTYEAANGLRSITADNSPWREVTEPLNVEPVRSAVVGTSARNG